MILTVGTSPVCTMNLVDSAPWGVSATAVIFLFTILYHLFLTAIFHEQVRRERRIPPSKKEKIGRISPEDIQKAFSS